MGRRPAGSVRCECILAAALLLVVWFAPKPAWAQASSSACPSGNLLESAKLIRQGQSLQSAAMLTDRVVAREGRPFATAALLYVATGSELVFELAAEHQLKLFQLQSDADDDYWLDLSADGRTWKRARLAPLSDVEGLRLRSLPIPSVPAKFVRLASATGDGYVALSEVRAFCEPPPAAAAGLRLAPENPRLLKLIQAEPWLEKQQMTWIKIGLLGAALALAFAVRLFERPIAWRGAERRWAFALVALGAIGWLSYFNLGAYRFPGFLHRHDYFHYYVGSKYFAELGYDRLYDCTQQVDIDDGYLRRAGLRQVRRLSNNEVVQGSELFAAAAACKGGFSAERWRDFGVDVRAFRDVMSLKQWHVLLRDFGYNGSPLGRAITGGLAGLGSASGALLGDELTPLRGGLASLDVVLLVLVVAGLAWGFGLPAACLGALALGCNALSGFEWVGGSLLRQQWLVGLVLGLACLARGRYVLGGVLLGYATLNRVFPGVTLAVVLAALLWQLWRTRRLDRAGVEILAGAGVTLLVGVLATGGAGTWLDFLRNLRMHSLIEAQNLVGLKSLLSFRPDTRVAVLFDPSGVDAFAAARAARVANFAQLAPLYWLLAAIGAAATLLAAIRQSGWAHTAAAGLLLIPWLASPSCYYYSFLVALAPLCVTRPPLSKVLLALLLALFGAQALLTELDVSYAAMSAMVLLFSGVALFALARR